MARARFALLGLLSVHAVLGVSLPKRVSDGDFFDVTEGGGSWLDSGNGSLGEPLNVKCFQFSVPAPHHRDDELTNIVLIRLSSPASALRRCSRTMVSSILPRQLDCVSLDNTCVGY
jgi:hypothetical protein